MIPFILAVCYHHHHPPPPPHRSLLLSSAAGELLELVENRRRDSINLWPPSSLLLSSTHSSVQSVCAESSSWRVVDSVSEKGPSYGAIFLFSSSPPPHHISEHSIENKRGETIFFSFFFNRKWIEKGGKPIIGALSHRVCVPAHRRAVQRSAVQCVAVQLGVMGVRIREGYRHLLIPLHFY